MARIKQPTELLLDRTGTGIALNGRDFSSLGSACVISRIIWQVATSAYDVVDGSSTGTRVPWMWALLKLPRFGGANDADDHDNRFDIAKSVFQVHELMPHA